MPQNNLHQIIIPRAMAAFFKICPNSFTPSYSENTTNRNKHELNVVCEL